jgi:hypothetical protein
MITICLSSCEALSTRPEAPLESVFSNSELKDIKEIIYFYDSFVLSHTDKNLSIDEAYLSFLETYCPIANESGDLGILMPEKQRRIDLYQRLDQTVLSEIYEIQDTVKYFDFRTRKEKVVYKPYFISGINPNGRYVDLLEKLSHKNSFLSEYYQKYLSLGGLGPYHYVTMLMHYNNFNFSYEEERFVFIVSALGVLEEMDPDE